MATRKKSKKLTPWRKHHNVILRARISQRNKIDKVCRKHNVKLIIHYAPHPFEDLRVTTTGMEYREDDMAVGKDKVILYWSAESVERGELAIAELLMQYRGVVVIHNVGKGT